MKNWLKRNYYRLVNYNKNVKIGKGVVFNVNNTFEGLNFIDDKTLLVSSSVGLGTYIAGQSVIKHTQIGRFCSIGSNIQTGLGTHPSKDFVSTHPAFFSTAKQAGFTFVEVNRFNDHIYADDGKKYIVTIGNDVWIGNNVIITDGIKIGDGAIIAAGAVVTKDVLPYAIVGGIPAKPLRDRFTKEQTDKLLNIKWWNWELAKIKAHSHLFGRIEQFISAVDKEHK